MVRAGGIGSTPTRRRSHWIANDPYWARGFATSRARDARICASSSAEVLVGDDSGARDRDCAQLSTWPSSS